MEIQEPTSYTFYFSRLLGLAPFFIKRNSTKTRIDEIRVSLLICFYSITFLLMTVYLTVRFIFLDANSKTPIRMRTATSKFVTVLDVCVVVSACICGVFSGIWGVKSIQNVNDKLREADKELSTGINEVRRDKRYNAIMLGFVFLTMSGMIILDVFSKSRNAKKYKKTLEEQNKPTDEVHIEIYFPFYVAYYMLMALHTHFAQTAIGIKRRYRRLNSSLKNIFALKKIIDSNNVSRNRTHRIEVQPHKDKSKATNESNLSGETTNAVASIKPMNKITVISRAIQDEKHTTPVFAAYGKLPLGANALSCNNYFLDRLSYTHAILGEAVYLVSSSCGLTVLTLLASCLLHLVSTMYFLFIELLGDTDGFVAGLQLLWCCFHLALLLLIVEPCHMASVEARKTVLIVSDVLRNCKENSVELILHRFWKQLIGDRTYSFTACGLCVIDRQILTSIGGAIATYLVILIQFQNSMGKQ